MNIQEIIEKKEKELQTIEKIITETLIISQLKYSDYLNEKDKIKNEITELKEKIENEKNEKTWINLEGGWRKRINKNE